MHPGRKHAIDIRDRPGQFLAQRENHLGALLNQRRYEPVSLEHLAESGEFLFRQTVVVEYGDRVSEAALVDRNRDTVALADRAFGWNAVLAQCRNDLVGLPLIEVGVEIGLAGSDRESADNGCRQPHHHGPPAAALRSEVDERRVQALLQELSRPTGVTAP